MTEHFIILGRSIAALAILLLITRTLGKQTLSNMTFHDFVAAVTLGAIAANLAFNGKIKITLLLISLVTFSGISFILSKLAMKSLKVRKLISGAPSVLIQNGKILEDNMKKNKYTLDSLNEMLREKDIFDIQEVEYALLETNGRLSIMRKQEYKGVTVKDLKLLIQGQQQFPVELIMDGVVLTDNLNDLALSMNDISEDVKKKGKTLDEVFYAVRSTDGQIYYDFYADNIKKPIDKE